MVAAVFEAQLTQEQADRLADLMREARPTRPEAVLTATLLYENERAQLVAIWRDRESLDRYLAETSVPRGVELMRKVGAEPTMRIVPVLEHG